MIAVSGLAEAMARLARTDLRAAGRAALERGAQRLEAAVQGTLSHSPGEDHTAPWLRTGALRASITHQVDDDTAVVGSNDQVAVYQELGTQTIPPRPFLAATAAAEAEGVVRKVAAVIAGCLDQGMLIGPSTTGPPNSDMAHPVARSPD